MNWPEWMLYRIPALATANFSQGKVNSLRDGAREVLAAINGIALVGPEGGVVWRGHANIGWRLESKASRLGLDAEEVAERERLMLVEARRIGMDDAQRMGDWEILARLRHNGAVTRLIDCTSDPFIALWFLCDDDSPGAQEADGVLLAMQRLRFTSIDTPYERGNYERMLEKTPAMLIYSTPPIDPRIAAQRGLFVLHSHPLSPGESPASELGLVEPPSKSWRDTHRDKLSKLCGSGGVSSERGRPLRVFPEMIGVVVPARVKPILLQMLQTNFGFSRSSIFPDFAGLGEVYSR